MHHPQADIDGLYEKREEGGRDMPLIEVTSREEKINIADCLNT